VLIGAIGFGVWAGLVAMGLMAGMTHQQVQAAIETRTAHLQIHANGFRRDRDINLVIPDGLSVLSRVGQTVGVDAVAARTVVTGMATSPTTGSPVEFFGINPESERRVSDVARRMVEGTYFETSKRNPIVVGSRLANKLGVRLGQKMVFTSQATDGSITSGAFRIVGMYKTVSSAFDETAVFALQQDVDKIFGVGGRLHEIAIVVRDVNSIDAVADKLRKEFPGLDVATWKDLSPELALSYDMTNQMNMVFVSIILVALVFGITNTMLMGVIERTREIGVAMALGMKQFKVFQMIVLESVLLSIVGGAVGTVSGAATLAVLSRTGINLASVSTGLEALAMSSIIYPTLSFGEYPSVLGLLMVAAVLASVYPGIRAIRLNPADAIRTY
jgi:ABC-type lipoprotein release transport system permease subunit